MKVHSRIAIVALSLNLLLPTATLAMDGSAESSPSPSSSPEVHKLESQKTEGSTVVKSTAVKPEDAAKFCTNVTKTKENITGTTKVKADTLKSGFDKRTSSLTTKRAEITHRFAELEAKAKTDAQKAAVKTYEDAVLAAIAKHRAAVDTADKTFLDGVTASVETRQSQLVALTQGYQAAVSLAITQAKVSCSAGVAPTTVRQNLSTTLKTIQAKFTDARKALEKSKPNLDPLKDAHKAAIKQADADFRTALKSAYTALKAVLLPGDKSSTDTDKPEASSSPTPSVSSTPKN
jgi:chromosome segregation ATPase